MCLYPLHLPVFTKKYGYKGMTVPCGRCFECLQQRSNEWAYRVMLEATKHKDSCFVTLTYNEDNLPEGGTLVKRDMQNFLKRLREKLRQEDIFIRFFGCGEYGSKGLRPHYHLIVFGWKPSDLVYFFTDKKGKELYKSRTIERLWNKGFITVGDLDFDSAKYCAKYMQKFDANKDKRQKPFTLMSRRPGLGDGAITSNVLKTDKIYYRGKYIKIPRFYLDRFSKEFPVEVDLLKDKRIINHNNYKLDPVSVEEKFNKKLSIHKKISKKFNKFFDMY